MFFFFFSVFQIHGGERIFHLEEVEIEMIGFIEKEIETGTGNEIGIRIEIENGNARETEIEIEIVIVIGKEIAIVIERGIKIENEAEREKNQERKTGEGVIGNKKEVSILFCYQVTDHKNIIQNSSE